jgi:hypothetical protein
MSARVTGNEADLAKLVADSHPVCVVAAGVLGKRQRLGLGLVHEAEQNASGQPVSVGPGRGFMKTAERADCLLPAVSAWATAGGRNGTVQSDCTRSTSSEKSPSKSVAMVRQRNSLPPVCISEQSPLDQRRPALSTIPAL